MIRQIEEYNFPEYATLHQATVTLTAMGDRTITTQLRIDGDVEPEFGVTENGVFKPMELKFRGERFILPIREPQATKDNTTRNSLIDLTFYSWPIYQLKRYFFVEMASTSSGTAIADKYIASLSLNLENFVDAFNLVLDYYFGGKIQLDLFSKGQGFYSVEPVFFDINYSYLWDVLTKINELYDVRWWVEYDEPNDVYYIKIGYPSEGIEDHDFSYGYEGGLLKFERQVQDDNIANILLGRGGEKNLPYRYYKREDEYNTEWTADPDAIAELANIYFDRLRDINFRWYVRGWMQNENRDHSWENAGYIYPTYDESSIPEQYLFAYLRGKTDSKFNPVEYVKDDDSIAKFGEHWGALDNNDDIYPTIQGVTRPLYGRMDECVAISEIETDDIQEYSSNAAIETSLRDMTVSLNRDRTGMHILESDSFTIPDGNVGNIFYRPMAKDTANPNSVYFDTTRSYIQAVQISSGSGDIVNPSYDPSTGNYSIEGLPAGTYRLRLNMVLRIDLPATSATGTFGIENIVLSTSAINTNAWKPTFDIWVKNIWETTQGVNESDADYSTRVWTSILGDRVGNEAKIVFSTGAMSISQDYEFVIASYPVVDRTRTINGVASEWKISVFKSDAEYQATGLYIPNAQSAQPVAGDKFFFTGIDMPHIYVLWAEEDLNAYKTTELEKQSDISPTWIITLDKVRVHTIEDDDFGQTLAERLNAGITIRTTDPRFTHGDILTLYIQSITFTWNEPSKDSPYLVPDIEVVLSDKIVSKEGPLTSLQNDVDIISRAYVQTSDVEAVVRKIAGSLYLKKTGESDKSSSPTSFSSKVTSTNFRKGGIGGRGWGIYQDNSQVFAPVESSVSTRSSLKAATRALTDTAPTTPQIDTKSVMEVDKLIVRDEMQVNSLVVNQISYRGGKEIISAASIEVTQVIETSDSYVCYFDQKQNSVANLFEVNDIAYGQVWTADNYELRYYKSVITATDINSITLSKRMKDGAGAPKVGDVIVQYGNISDISRQYVIVRDVIGGGYERMLSGLNSVTASGTEYYFAGTQVSESSEFVPLFEGDGKNLLEANELQLGSLRQRHSPRWFVGDADGQYAEYKDGELNINGILSVTTQLAKSDGTYYSLSTYLDYIYNQLGSDISVWYENGTPTLENYPAVAWDTVAVKNNHLGDLYFDNQTGNTYIFVLEDETYSWETISREEFDEAVANNLKGAIAGLKYLQDATNRGTMVQGGLVLTSLLQLGKTENEQFNVWAGINGLRDDEEYGGGIAAWYGGPMVDHEADPTEIPYAQSLFRFDGSGYLAGGLLNWGIDDQSGQAFLNLNGETVVAGLDVSLNDIANLLFEVVQYQTGHYAVKLKARAYYNGISVNLDGLYADGFVSAGGLSGTSGGGGGGAVGALNDLSDVDILSPQSGDVLYYNGRTWTNEAINLNGFVTTSVLTSTLAGYVSKSELQGTSITMWGQTASLGDTIDGDLSSVGKIAFDVQGSASASGNILEVVNIGTTESPIYVLHSTLPIYSDGFVSAGGLSSSGSPLSISLSDLADVDLTEIGADKVLAYNDTTGKWEPRTISGGSGDYVLKAGDTMTGRLTVPSLAIGTAVLANSGNTLTIRNAGATTGGIKLDNNYAYLQRIGSSSYGGVLVGDTGVSLRPYNSDSGGLVVTANDVTFNGQSILNGGGGGGGTYYAGTGLSLVNSTFSLQMATTSVIGGVRPAAQRNIASSSFITGGTTANRYYGVEMNNNGQLFVNVPWSGDGGGASGDYLPLSGGTMTGTINAQDIIPKSANTYDLGSATNYWKRIYLGYDSTEGESVYLYYDDTNKCVRINYAGLAADGFVSAGGISPTGGVFSLGDLLDVDIETVSPSDGQLLGYNATTRMWEPIISTTPSNDDVLVYNSTTKKWVPTPISSLINQE